MIEKILFAVFCFIGWLATGVLWLLFYASMYSEPFNTR